MSDFKGDNLLAKTLWASGDVGGTSSNVSSNAGSIVVWVSVESIGISVTPWFSRSLTSESLWASCNKRCGCSWMSSNTGLGKRGNFGNMMKAIWVISIGIWVTVVT